MRAFAVALCLVVLVVLAVPAHANCAFPTSGVTSGVQAINFIPLGYEPFGTTLDAIGTWAFGCSGSGYGYPDLSTGAYNSSPGVMNVYVFYHPGNSTSESGRCGVTSLNIDQQTGAISGATIHMWQRQANGGDCSETMDALVAHEIGHVLGLGDVDHIASCNGTIMGQDPSFISTDQCEAVNDSWRTQQESDTGDTGGDGPEDGHSACSELLCNPPGEGSPILLDIDRNGFHLVGRNDSVSFDLTGDGVPELITWTAAGSGDAFLALDRNENGTIDDGTELFGNYTPKLGSGTAANGYEALRELDWPVFGGNGDELLTSADRIWNRLLLWVDRNHDGLSQKSELSSLASAGVLALETAYTLSLRRDRHGNMFRFKGKAWLTNSAAHGHSAPTYDVFFLK